MTSPNEKLDGPPRTERATLDAARASIASARRALAAALMLAAALLSCAGAASARAQTATATLGGSVLDEAGAVIPGVEITVLNLSTALERHATTNDEGVYVIPLLPPGNYNVTAAREGFTTVEHRGVTLSVGDQLALRIKLRVGEIGETVTVYDHVNSSSRESAAVATLVNRRFVENLPLNGRSFQTLLELAPGTTLTRASFSEQGQFSASGQRANANYFTIDGVSANVGVSAGAAPGQAAAGSLPALTVLGGTNNLVSVESVEEFQIQTSTYAPEYGRTPGAQVSVVTRGGTNEFHGSLFNYFRNDALDANDWFANSRDLARASLRQNDFGGSIGGPLRRDRTFFFASYEGLRLRQPQVALTDVPALAARAAAPADLRPFLDAFPLPTGSATGAGFAEFAASYSDRSGFDAASIRIDHTPSDKVTVFGRYNFAPSRTTQRGGAAVVGFSGQSLNTVSRTSLDTETLTAGATFTLAPELLDELRVNLSRVEGTTSLALDDFGGAVVPSDALLFPPTASTETAGFQFALRGGANSNFGVGRNARNLQRQLNVVNNLSIIRGRHHLKVGFDYRRLTPSYGPLRYSQSVVFGDAGVSGVAAALTGRASQVKVIADSEPRVPVFTNFSAYAQDTARVTPRLTVTYGLRWELNPPPRERDGRDPFAIAGLTGNEGGIVVGGVIIRPCVGSTCDHIKLAPRGTPLWRTTYANFAPRAGAAYLLSPSRGTTLRGGVGVFYDLGNGQAAQAFGSVFPFVKEKSLRDVTFPLSPGQAEPPPVDLDPPFGTIYAFSPGLKLPLTFQWSATVEHPLGQSDTVSASYVGARGRRLLRQTALVNPNPNFTLVRLTVNSSSSAYQGLQLQYARRLSRGLQAHASYTWARSTDDDSDDSSGLLLTNIFDPARERGPSTFDVRHSLVAAATYNLPNPFRGGAAHAFARGWNLDAILRARTATPVNIFFATGALVGDLVPIQRPNLVAGVPVYVDDALAPGGRRLNPEAFQIISGTQGTLGRNAVRGFGFSQLDASLRRSFRLSERLHLQLRADIFNVFNHPSFGDPIGDLGSPHFGKSRQTLARSLGTGGVNAGLSPLYQVGGPRSVQLAVRLQF